jgi:hypothetical protein
VLTSGEMLDYSLIWLDDQSLISEKLSKSTESFMQLSKFIKDNAANIIPNNRNQLLTTLKKYEIAYKAVDVILALSYTR